MKSKSITGKTPYFLAGKDALEIDMKGSLVNSDKQKVMFLTYELLTKKVPHSQQHRRQDCSSNFKKRQTKIFLTYFYAQSDNRLINPTFYLLPQMMPTLEYRTDFILGEFLAKKNYK
jgi:hypothetical protein